MIHDDHAKDERESTSIAKRSCAYPTSSSTPPSNPLLSHTQDLLFACSEAPSTVFVARNHHDSLSLSHPTSDLHPPCLSPPSPPGPAKTMNDYHDHSSFARPDCRATSTTAPRISRHHYHPPHTRSGAGRRVCLQAACLITQVRSWPPSKPSGALLDAGAEAVVELGAVEVLADEHHAVDLQP